ncbi:MAG TPA: hypothetical protein VLA34_01895, partial [Candidatus Krumholzibacterium sp.]|nr:hypothetical protein [Candidatus Krumholzibacterium sp.]
IAARQRQMGELMRQIEEESRGTGEMLGSLDGIGEEMERIAKMLDEGRLDKDLMEREERILSRMLESQRSLNRRDYSRERKSRTGEEMRAAEGDYVPGEDERTRLLLERIRNSMREKGPAEYEELIRAYFRALSGKVRSDGGK